MSRWVFDIETDGYLHQCTRMWILVAYNLDTHEHKIFLEGDLSWIELFNNATLLVGHNILGFDLAVLIKLFKYRLPKTCSVQDTLILSQTLDFKRFGDQGHSIDAWGMHLGFPKIDHSDDPFFFSRYSEEMRTYCIRDVDINVMIYKELSKEFSRLIAKAPQFRTYLKAEHYAAKWAMEASLHGWPFDVEKAKELMTVLEREMNIAYESLSSKLGMKSVAVDKKLGIVDIKKPKWTKQGFYDAHTARWFDIDPCSGFEGEERPVVGEYCRVEFKALSLDSPSDVKIFLFRNGWQPTDWNYKVRDGHKVKTSPKITDDSLEFLGGDGKLYTDFTTTKSRHAILKTWLENIDADGNLHGECTVIGTPSMRSRHSIIVNVPSGDSAWGKEMRSLFKAKPGWKLIGCDSASNQARGLAYYLGNEEYIHTLLHGDVHQYNADVLTNVLFEMEMVHEVKRSQAKRILYAFLFGASGGKLWSYIFGYVDDEFGKRLKNGFLKAVPGFKELVDKLAKIYSSTKKFGDGYIPGIAGNRLYVNSYHKLLVYLLQAFEKATCSTALMLTVDKLEEHNIPYIPCIYYHDEIDFMVPEEYAEKAREIGKQAFADGPKLFGVEIMDGDGKIGDNWYEVH
jgi:DNA polymerase-1